MVVRDNTTLQLSFPGMPEKKPPPPLLPKQDVPPGTVVSYIGNFSGGPRCGSRGVVKYADRNQVVVDLGSDGNWKIPHYYLQNLSKAA